MKSRLYPLLISIALFLLIIPFDNVPSLSAERKHLDILIEEGLENNPQIKAAYNNWKASEYKVRQVTSLPDPMASFSYFGENVETRVGPQETKYELSQKIPFPGKLSLKGKVQVKETEILKEKYETAKRKLIKDIKFVYFDLFWVDKAIKITEEEKTILENLEKVAQRKYESNLGPQQDVVKAGVELSKLIDKLFILRQNRASLVAKMNSLLNRPGDTALETIGDILANEFVYERKRLQEIAVGHRQELRQAGLNIEKHEFETSLARLDYFPDFTFGLDYIQVGSGHTMAFNDGQDAWMGKIAINLPIWFDKLDSKLEEKKLALESSRENYEDLQNFVTYEVDDLFFKIIAYRDIISLYESALIPQTEQAFEAARMAYETGMVDFLNWLDSERILLQTRLAYYKAIVDYNKSIAFLERVVGTDL